MIQEVVWAISIVLMGALAALFAWVAMGANVAVADYGPVIASAYRLRTWLFGLAVIVLIGVNYDTLGKLPYVSSMSAPGGHCAARRCRRRAMGVEHQAGRFSGRRDG